jgi:hypothetical protein
VFLIISRGIGFIFTRLRTLSGHVAWIVMELARFFFTRLPLIGTFIVAQKELLNRFTAASAWREPP